MSKYADIVVCIIGDIHGDWVSTNKIMRKELADLYLSTGDVCDNNYRYETLNCPIYSLFGNHEDFDIVEAYRRNSVYVGNLNFIFPGKIYEVNGIRFGGLGGNHSPKYYSYRRKDLPFPKNRNDRNGKADRRRHFVEEEVELCKKKLHGIDILITHESPSFYEKYMRFPDHGSGKIIDNLVKTVKPKLHIWGHHHKYFVGDVDGILSIGLAYPRVSYLRINFTEKKVYLVDTETGAVKDEKSLETHQSKPLNTRKTITC